MAFRPKSFSVFTCAFTCGMLEVNDVHVGSGDDAVGCIRGQNIRKLHSMTLIFLLDLYSLR